MTFVFVLLLIGGGAVVNKVVERIGQRRPAIAEGWYAAWTVACVILAAASFASGQGTWGLWMTVCAMIDGLAWWHWHNRRKNRKRAAKLAGYKARAALAALVRKARESAKPRPVLRPVPGGAR